MTSRGVTGVVRAYQRRAMLRGAASAFDLRGDTSRQYIQAASALQANKRARRDDLRVVMADADAARDKQA